MLNVDRHALICDLAETYNIYDFKSLPCHVVGIFACGLRSDSRIILKLSEQKVTTDQLILASILDTTKMLLWINSEDGRKNRNRPESIAKKLAEGDTKESQTFDSGEDFMAEWAKYTGGGGVNG